MSRWTLWAGLVMVNLLALELLLCVYFFQRRSDFPLAITHYVHWQSVHLQQRFLEPARSARIFEEHLRLGYAHIPNSRGRHRTDDFDVSYSIGAEGERLIPPAEAPLGSVLFLGDSYTFGFGVEDDESYPYLLATKYWRNWQIVNKAVNGWGTSHSYIVLRDELQRPDPPSAVVYAMIPDTFARNYIRKSWVEAISQSGRRHPHFELVDGELAFQGTVGIDEAVVGSPALRRKELDLSAELLIAMNAACRRSGVPFILLLLPQKHPSTWGPVDWPPRVVRRLAEADVSILDLSERKPEFEYFSSGVHPNSADHERIARLVAESFVSEMLDDRSRPSLRGRPTPTTAFPDDSARREE